MFIILTNWAVLSILWILHMLQKKHFQISHGARAFELLMMWRDFECSWSEATSNFKVVENAKRGIAAF